MWLLTAVLIGSRNHAGGPCEADALRVSLHPGVLLAGGALYAIFLALLVAHR